jgi:hypothetical protein
MAADIRCYTAVICQCFLEETCAISMAWDAKDVAIGENSEILALGKPMAKRRRGDLPDGFCRIVRLISTA